MEPYFYETFIKDDCLLTIWKGLWDNAEYPSLMKDMEFLRIENKKEFKDIYTLIVKYKIRFDALDYIFIMNYLNHNRHLSSFCFIIYNEIVWVNNI